MICPNCDTRIRPDEYLKISDTRADGFFSVQHVQSKRRRLSEILVCKIGWYNKLSIGFLGE